MQYTGLCADGTSYAAIPGAPGLKPAVEACPLFATNKTPQSKGLFQVQGDPKTAIAAPVAGRTLSAER